MSTEDAEFDEDGESVVSIPLRGRCNVNNFVWDEASDLLPNWLKFPSPCGEDVMSTGVGLVISGLNFSGFHPLAGKM